VSQGTAGEIYVGGEGVARGYLNRPELNAERFIPDPFSPTNPSRLYRSGDLARQLGNDDLEYLGRIDHQVKIHGFRIELGEIEAVLNSHPAIRESVVIADSADGEKRLVAYAVPRRDQPAIAEIREFVGKRLPGYMTPARFVFLESLPLTVNGKVDRAALPAVDDSRPALSATYVEPRTDVERTLATIWQEVLGIAKVGIQDNFFELGGDSIRSIQVLAKAQLKGINFSLQKLFQKPAISALVENLDDAREDENEESPVPFALISEADQSKLPPDIEDAYPIGRLQNGMIFHSDLDKDSAIFHDVFSFRLNLPYQPEKLRLAINRLGQRHSIFRTSFHLNEFSEPLQLVHKKVEIPFSEENLTDRSPAERRTALIDWVEAEKRQRFDWAKAPLMRLRVQRHGDAEFQFIVSFHHAIMDGWSLAMMLTELFQDYMGLVSENNHEIAGPKVTYRDFVQLEQRTSRSPLAQEYWRRKIKDVQTAPLPRWPHPLAVKAHEQVRGPEIYFPDTLLRKLQNLARSSGVPIRSVLLAAHCRVMSLLTGQEEFLTGLVANGRPQCTDGERLIGLFLNTLPFRTRVGGTWKELIRATFAAEQELIPHRRMPLADIQQFAEGNSLFETAFDFVQFHVYKDLPGYSEHTFLEDHYFEANNFNFFVTFMLDASATELQLHFDYNPNEFPREQIEAICRYYSEALRAIAEAPDSPCDRPALLPSEERTRLLREWNQTEFEIPDEWVHQQVSAQAQTNPRKPAVIFNGTTISYQELNERANGIAFALQKAGASPGSVVGVFLERSFEMLASIFGVLKAGCAYLPLDPNYPEERLNFMVRDSGLKVILTQSNLLNRASQMGPLQLIAADQVDPTRNEPANFALTGEHLAYVIYTSGSTGQPKGVQISHRALANFLASMRREPGISDDDTLLAVTTLSFDIAGLELWLPLISGAKVLIATSEEARDPAALSRLIRENRVTVMQATPVTWNALIHSGWKGDKKLKALCGGEAMTPQVAKALLERSGSVWNMYGPTETTIWSALSRLRAGEETITIGKPIANTEFYILDASLEPVPTGSDGEIYIGGAGLSQGYLNRPELTRDKFIPHPFKPNARLYRTGDLGRYLPDGRLVCLGRTDHQVKVRGFRIELGEIESALEEHPAIRKAVVHVRKDDAAINELLAFWTPSERAETDEQQLRAFLKEKLPGYMVPTAWMRVSEFPLTPNGKIDRKQLPEIVSVESNSTNRLIAARTPFEEDVADTWRAILKVREIGITEDFFAAGGHSLAAMRVVGNLRSKYNVELSLASFFQQPTIEALAAEVEKLVKSDVQDGKRNEEATVGI
jgi:amino acid adenylation domain-containing protein